VPAHFVIDHTAGEVTEWLERAFGHPSATALTNSVLGHPVQSNPRYLAWAWLGCTVIAYSPTNATLNMSIEPTGTVDLRGACETTWRALVKNAETKRPTLRSLTLDDGTSGHELARATTNFGAHMKRPENAVAYVTALATLIWFAFALTLFGASADLILGAIPALVAAVVVAVLAVLYSWRKKLVWM
jgi:hypothetical protein